MYILQQIIDGITAGGPVILLALALALTLTLGYLRALNVAVGTFLTITAFFTVRATSHTSSPVIVALVAIVGGALLTIGVELFLLRPMRGRTNDIELGSFIATFGITLAGVAVVQSATGSQVISFNASFPELDRVIHIGSIKLSMLNLIGVIVTILVGLSLMMFMRLRPTGKALRALASDWEGGQLVGIRVNRLALLVAVISGALIGAAGFLTAVEARGMNFLVGESSLLLAFAIVVVGGVGSLGGALIIGVIVNAATAVLSAEVSSQFSEAMVFAVLFVVLAARPEGLGRIGPARRRGSKGLGSEVLPSAQSPTEVQTPSTDAPPR